MNHRIKKYGCGWVSEILVPKWTLLGIKYKWEAYIKRPLFFGNKQVALTATIEKMKEDIEFYERNKKDVE